MITIYILKIIYKIRLKLYNYFKRDLNLQLKLGLWAPLLKNMLELI